MDVAILSGNYSRCLAILRFPVSNFQIFIGNVFFFCSAVIFELKTDQQIGLVFVRAKVTQ